MFLTELLCHSLWQIAVPTLKESSSIRVRDQRNTFYPEVSLSLSAIFHNCSRKQRAPTQTAVMCDLKEKNILAHSQTAPVSAARELLQYMRGLWSTSCYTFKLFIVRLRVTGIVWHLKAWSFLRALFPAWLLSICFSFKLRSCGVKCTSLLPLRRNGFPALTRSMVSL